MNKRIIMLKILKTLKIYFLITMINPFNMKTNRGCKMRMNEINKSFYIFN